jgi:hypothetical protein
LGGAGRFFGGVAFLDQVIGQAYWIALLPLIAAAIIVAGG